MGHCCFVMSVYFFNLLTALSARYPIPHIAKVNNTNVQIGNVINHQDQARYPVNFSTTKVMNKTIPNTNKCFNFILNSIFFGIP